MGKQRLAGGCRRLRGGFSIPRERLFVLAFWTQQFALAAAYQDQAPLHAANGTIAQIVRLPGVLRDTLLAKKTFGDRSVVFALIASVQCTQHQRKPLAPLRRMVGQRWTRRTAAQRPHQRLGSRARSPNEASSGSSIACAAPATGRFFIQTRCVVSPNRSPACQPSMFCRNSVGDSRVRSRAIG